MAQGLSKGCAGLLVFPCVSSTCVDTSQDLYKPEESQKIGQSSGKKTSEFTSKHDPSFAPQWQETVHREAGARRPLRLQPSQKRRWMERKSGKCTGSSTYSFTLRSSGFQKTSSASLSSLLYPPDQWIEIPSGLHAIAVAMGHVRYGQGTTPSCTRQGKHGKHHLGTTHGTLAHRISDWMHTGKSSPTGPISEGP